VQRILIIQTAFIGDVILMTPIISELKRIFPEVQLDVLVKKGNEVLLANNPKINTVYTFDKSQGKRQSMIQLIKLFRKKNYDLTLNLHRYASSGIIASFSGAKKIYGFRKNPFSFLYSKRFEHHIGDGTHEVERNLSLIREFGSEIRIRPELYPTENAYKLTESLTSKPYVCIAPASVWKTKQVPILKWVELISKIENRVIYLIGAPSDYELCEEIRGLAANEQVVNLAGKHALMESAALIDKAERVYVNDSGPLHIASAMNTPTVAFFCSTVPEFGFGPLAASSSVEEVKGLDCRPCGIHGYNECPKGHFKCGNELRVNP
jgi:lipopolysaccharide heptosyltransferase II